MMFVIDGLFIGNLLNLLWHLPIIDFRCVSCDDLNSIVQKPFVHEPYNEFIVKLLSLFPETSAAHMHVMSLVFDFKVIK